MSVEIDLILDIDYLDLPEDEFDTLSNEIHYIAERILKADAVLCSEGKFIISFTEDKLDFNQINELVALVPYELKEIKIAM